MTLSKFYIDKIQNRYLIYIETPYLLRFVKGATFTPYRTLFLTVEAKLLERYVTIKFKIIKGRCTAKA